MDKRYIRTFYPKKDLIILLLEVSLRFSAGRERFSWVSKMFWTELFYDKKRRAMGIIIRNGKTKEKIIQNCQKICWKPQTAYKTVKTDTVVTSGADRANYTLTLLLSKYLWISWTCLKPFVSFKYLLASASFSLGLFHFPSKHVFF